MRLIDADAYLEKVCTYKETGCGNCKFNIVCPQDQPTVDMINKLDFAINATTVNDDYMVGLRNGLRLAKSYIDGIDPQFEKCGD